MRGESLDSKLRIGLVGYGEVGKILARAKDDGVETCASLAALLERADIVISAVTAANALDVAREAARSIRPGTFFLDLNSASPTTKTSASKLVDAAGAHYVEAGVMTPVPPYGIRAPMLLGGNRAGALADKAVPERVHQRAGSRHRGELYARPPSRCGAPPARFAHGNLSRDRLGKTGLVPLRPRGEARQAPRRGDARSGEHRARGRVRALDVSGERPNSGLGRGTFQKRPVPRLGRGTGLARLRRQDHRGAGEPRNRRAQPHGPAFLTQGAAHRSRWSSAADKRQRAQPLFQQACWLPHS